MKILVGDKVRFLNNVGGGEVCRVEGGKMLYVLDEDGFEIPVLSSEVVVVERKTKEVGVIDGDVVVEEESFVEEDKNEGEPKLVIAFVKEAYESGNVEMYFVNDSSFFVLATIGLCTDSEVNNLYNGIIEPNTKYNIGRYAVNSLDGKSLVVQGLLYKSKYSYTKREALDVSFKLAGAKLMKQQSFVRNEYLDDNAYLLYVLKTEFQEKIDKVTGEDIRKAMLEKNQTVKEKKVSKSNQSGILEVDLHIHELLDDTRGLSNKDMLEFQLKKFHDVMRENESEKGKKIVFIHGKGNGVLKSEILKCMKSKYKWHAYQDASFREYGFGATMVIV